MGAFLNTAQLHMTERISRPNLRMLVYPVTIDDPGAYTKKWSGGWTIPGGEMFESICEDAGR